MEQRIITEHKTRDGTMITVETPAPDLVFYVSLLRGFLVARNSKAGDVVAKRMKQRFEYVRGQNLYVDAALDDLENLRELGEKWVYVPVFEREPLDLFSEEVKI